MPFPFFWVGALFAAAFLVTVFTVFGILLAVVNRAASQVGGSIIPGLLSGIRDWTGDLRPMRRPSSLAAGGDGRQLEELMSGGGPLVEPVRRTR